jgi:hypothetical protein
MGGYIAARLEERWDDYEGAEIPAVYLWFVFSREVVNAIRQARDAARAKGGWRFAGTFDGERRQWWFHPWAWPDVRTALRTSGVVVDDDSEGWEHEREESPSAEQPRPATPYEVLGIAPTATFDDATTAWRALCRQWHPDRIPLDVADELRQMANQRMKAINVAYDAIKSRYARSR